MGIKAWIPFTQERRQRMFATSLANMAKGNEGLVEVEWGDGTKSLKPVEFDDEQHRLVSEDGFKAKLKGLGSEPKFLAGTRLWNANAANYGIISTQAALIANRERTGEGFYEGPAALRFLLEEYIEELRDFDAMEVDRTDGDSAEVATDGAGVASAGQTARALADNREDPMYDTLADWLEQAPEDLTVYDLNPPEDVDAEVFSVRDPNNFDPFPVNREDAERAVEWAEQKATAQDEWWSGFVTALLVAAGLYGLFRIVPSVVAWMLGAIGGGGGVSIGMTLMPLLGGLL